MKQSKIERIMKSNESLTERKLKNFLKREEQEELEQRNQKPVSSIEINIEWKKSKTWGSNPHAEARIHFADGTYQYKDGYTCSGCGYDKESTVIARIFNEFLRYELWNMEDKDITNKPYGINLDFDYNPYYDGGIGTSCYRSISEFIGGEFETIASGKSFDSYKFTKTV